MKVFVQASELAEEKPVVIASYPDGSDVRDDAHGEGMTVLTLPMSVIESSPASGGLPFLISNWRERAGSLPVKGEAKRQIEEVFSLSDQLNAIHEIIDLIIKHGVDLSQWSAEAKTRKAELDEKWNYVGEVRERARAHAVAPLNPGIDKIWPRRPAKN